MNYCTGPRCITMLPPDRTVCRFCQPHVVVLPPDRLEEPEDLRPSRYSGVPICSAYMWRGDRCGRRVGHRGEHRSEWSVRCTREARRSRRAA